MEVLEVFWGQKAGASTKERRRAQRHGVISPTYAELERAEATSKFLLSWHLSISQSTGIRKDTSYRIHFLLILSSLHLLPFLFYPSPSISSLHPFILWTSISCHLCVMFCIYIKSKSHKWEKTWSICCSESKLTYMDTSVCTFLQGI